MWQVFRIACLVYSATCSCFIIPIHKHTSTKHRSNQVISVSRMSTDATECTEEVKTTTTTTTTTIDPKEIVKLFGRLAEKYIMLDASGGMCCYSACKDCEYRLPDGGYIMADQTASRPKWIPVYETRSFASSGKQHTSKWSTELFQNDATSMTRQEFVGTLQGLSYAPPLGGPYVGATSSAFIDDSAVNQWFDILAQGKDILTKKQMSRRMKTLADQGEGLTWAQFQAAF